MTRPVKDTCRERVEERAEGKRHIFMTEKKKFAAQVPACWREASNFLEERGLWLPACFISSGWLPTLEEDSGLSSLFRGLFSFEKIYICLERTEPELSN